MIRAGRGADLIDGAYLEAYPVVRSDDADFARDQLVATYGISGFDARGDGFSIRANFARLASIGLAYCAYDGRVSLSFPEADFIRQFFSISGEAKFSTSYLSRPICAWSPFLPAESRLRLDFEAGYRQLVVRIDTSALERTLKNLLGDASDQKLVFMREDPDPARMPFIRQDVFRFAQEIGRFGNSYSSPVLAEMEQNLILRFLLAHRHNFSDRLQRPIARAGRAVVDIIEAFIEANWDKPIHVADLARIANVSARTIFREFAVAGRGSPAQFAKHVRLRRAAEFLRQPDLRTTVTGVAFRCGFQNLGRFSSDYAQLMGELPSETLSRARARL
ncbi:MAG TPA: AraC family transcriptional regulator [Bradyrhizobium sp.]|uniref:helix-turn-helix transcriptional regulator n=1 Tax=Bradyrhizobium sp. TaxID=376 RepID=UPI002D7FA664|nr:AraC family transcriptional regulator [Bradyrhizobium sp.]HET7888092.1 AraC family transcriptional regulator [Bradyrhizobium sp.]